jgi:hypothetical protein
MLRHESDLIHSWLSLQVCPITLTLFQDPVCNALGQVYERAALQRHLLQVGYCSCPARMQAWLQPQLLVQQDDISSSK